MRTNLIITDNFYGDPDSVRKFALTQSFDVKGNYPGSRTKSFLTSDLMIGRGWCRERVLLVV